MISFKSVAKVLKVPSARENDTNNNTKCAFVNSAFVAFHNDTPSARGIADADGGSGGLSFTCQKSSKRTTMEIPASMPKSSGMYSFYMGVRSAIMASMERGSSARTFEAMAGGKTNPAATPSGFATDATVVAMVRWLSGNQLAATIGGALRMNG